MKKLGSWLALAALALQIGWPLLAGALPRSVALVPLCTVDGVTHYLEVPTGKDPGGLPAAHGEHCPLCCLGHAPVLPSGVPREISPERRSESRVARAPALHTTSVVLNLGARAPPLAPLSAS